ncbi:MAG: AAA domain-containing protein [Candidatus Eisenbacteria bacterium]|nr:AAA domain-containing protein [Candidatus Eisenbacteria bacterium]
MKKRKSAARSKGRPARSTGRPAQKPAGRGGQPPARQRATTRKRRKARLKPIVRGETETLLHLEELLSQRIVGKQEAIRRVANAIRIRRANLDFRPARPDGAFLLVGPPGVGKTEFACAVAEVLLGSDRGVVLLDMADYSEEDDVEDLLVTLHPDADGVLIQGTLTTPVRANPRIVILLRGLERAHPLVQRLLLHILDRGSLTDAQGEVSFQETVIFATSRLVPQEQETVEPIGFRRTPRTPKERTRLFLEQQFSPELIAAFNEVLVFDQLTPNEVKLIARYKVETVLDRLRRQKRGVEVSDKVYDAFIRDDEVRRCGARDLNRTLEEKIFTPLSKYLLSHADARHIRVDVRRGQLVIREPAE